MNIPPKATEFDLTDHCKAVLEKTENKQQYAAALRSLIQDPRYKCTGKVPTEEQVLGMSDAEIDKWMKSLCR